MDRRAFLNEKRNRIWVRISEYMTAREAYMNRARYRYSPITPESDETKKVMEAWDGVILEIRGLQAETIQAFLKYVSETYGYDLHENDGRGGCYTMFPSEVMIEQFLEQMERRDV